MLNSFYLFVNNIFNYSLKFKFLNFVNALEELNTKLFIREYIKIC